MLSSSHLVIPQTHFIVSYPYKKRNHINFNLSVCIWSFHLCWFIDQKLHNFLFSIEMNILPIIVASSIAGMESSEPPNEWGPYRAIEGADMMYQAIYSECQDHYKSIRRSRRCQRSERWFYRSWKSETSFLTNCKCDTMFYLHLSWNVQLNKFTHVKEKHTKLEQFGIKQHRLPYEISLTEAPERR